jgi:hypothetical protein
LASRFEGGRKNSEVVFPTSDVEKFSSEVDFSISEFFVFDLFHVFWGLPMGVPFGGVPLCTTRTVGSPSPRAVSRRLTLRLLGGVPFRDGNSCSFPFVAENVLLCIPLMGNER